MKIDMLYGQMFQAQHGSRRSLSIVTPVVSASVERTSEEDPDHDEKLRLIEAELRERQLVGTLADPRDYFAGIMNMRWGLFNDAGLRPADESPLVYFSGIDKEEPLIVGLGGSTANVIGHQGATSTYSRSNSHAIVRWLVAGLRRDGPPQLPDWWDMENERNDLFGGMGVALHYLRPPTQNLEFFAKTLTTGTLHGLEHMTGVQSARVILGTPLYVALAHPYPQEEAQFGLDDQW